MVNFKKKSRSQSSMMSNTIEMITENTWIYQQKGDYWSKTNGHFEGNLVISTIWDTFAMKLD